MATIGANINGSCNHEYGTYECENGSAGAACKNELFKLNNTSSHDRRYWLKASKGYQIYYSQVRSKKWSLSLSFADHRPTDNYSTFSVYAKYGNSTLPSKLTDDFDFAKKGIKRDRKFYVNDEFMDCSSGCTFMIEVDGHEQRTNTQH